MTTPTDALLNRSPVLQSSTWSGRRFIEGLRRRRRHLLFRSLMAAPFVVAFLLTLALGPATVDSKYISFGWLALVSLVVLVLMVAAPDWLLIPLGLVTFLIFPALAGVGFYFAPAWAVPPAAVVLYGSALASAAAMVTGLVKSYRRLLRGRRRVAIAKAIGATAPSCCHLGSQRLPARSMRLRNQTGSQRRTWGRSLTPQLGRPSRHSRPTVRPCTSTARPTRSASPICLGRGRRVAGCSRSSSAPRSARHTQRSSR